MNDDEFRGFVFGCAMSVVMLAGILSLMTLQGCTVRQTPEYRVVEICISGEVARTDFLLTKLER